MIPEKSRKSGEKKNEHFVKNIKIIKKNYIYIYIKKKIINNLLYLILQKELFSIFFEDCVI